MATKHKKIEEKGICGCRFTEIDDEIFEKLSLYMGKALKIDNKEDRNGVLALCVTYILLIFPRVAMSAITSNLKDDLGIQNTDISELLVVNGVSYALGKMFNGMIIDSMDARYVLWTFMTLSMLATIGWSFTNSKTAMYPFLFVNMYCQSGTWPSMAKLIYNWFDANAYAQTFSFLSMSSKIGSFCTLLILGGVVSATDWRWTLRVAALAIGLGLLYSISMMRNRPAPPMRKNHRKMTGKDEGRGCVPLLKVIYKSARFWLCLASISTMTVLAGMENLIPLLLTDVFRPCLDTDFDICDSTFDSGHAAIVAAFIPLGLILSLTFGHVYLSGKSPIKEAKASVIFLVGTTLMLVVFAIWTTMIESGSRPKENPWNWVGFLMVFIFLYGFCIGYPYYIPPAVYSVKVGGENSATLSALLDLGGFALLTVFARFGTALSEWNGVSVDTASTWRFNIYLVTIVSILSTLAMFGFQNYNLKAMKSARLQYAVDSFLETAGQVEGKPKVELSQRVKL